MKPFSHFALGRRSASPGPVTAPFAFGTLVCLCMFLLSACISQASPSLDKRKPQFSSLARSQDLQAEEFPLPFFLLGFEKEKMKATYEAAGFNPNAVFYQDQGNQQFKKEVLQKFDDPRKHFLSMIARFPNPGSAQRTVVFPYSQYVGSPLPEDLLKETRQQLDGTLAKELEEVLTREKTTHVFVFCTGWNTDQTESIKNHLDWAKSLKAAIQESHKEKEIRPLMIGLSWASLWRFFGMFSYFNKANDADELGMTWGNQLINGTLASLRAKHGFKLIVVGHSFGARLTTAALFSAPLLEAQGTWPASPKVDLYIGLQAAFSMNRFVGSRQADGEVYGHQPRPSPRMIYTSSRFDKAVKTMFLAPFISSEKGRGKLQDSPYREIFHSASLLADGRWQEGTEGDASKVTIFNADEVIYVDGKTGSGAHSDVYKNEIGRFLLQAVTTFSP